MSDRADPDEHTRRLLEWIAENENRRRVVRALCERPRNTNQLADALDLHYRTAQHHLRRLCERGALTSVGDGYGETYFPADRVETYAHRLGATGGADE